MIRLKFTNGQAVDYPTGVQVSTSTDGATACVIDGSGEVVALIPAADVAGVENVEAQ